MTTIQSILVPLDGSLLAKHAIPYAQALMGKGGSIALLHVIPVDQGYVPEVMESEFGWGVDEKLAIASKVRSNLHEFANEMETTGTLTALPKIYVEIGEPAETIVDMAKLRPSDLIVMTTHGYGSVKRALFGSVTDRVVRHSTVPVLVVRDQDDVVLGKSATIRRIVLPLDGSLLAENAVSMAKNVAKQLDVPILLVRALHLNYIVPSVEGALAVTQESIDDMFQYADEYLAVAQGQLSREGLDVSIATKWGAPFDVIDTLTRPDDLIVLTSHGRSGVGRWLLGSVAEKLIRTSRAPVLVVPVRETI